MNNSRVNLNTFLVAGLYALFAWVLLTLHNGAKTTAEFGAHLEAFRESSQRTERDMSEFRLRLAAVELEVARMKGRLP